MLKLFALSHRSMSIHRTDTFGVCPRVLSFGWTTSGEDDNWPVLREVRGWRRIKMADRVRISIFKIKAYPVWDFRASPWHISFQYMIFSIDSWHISFQFLTFLLSSAAPLVLGCCNMFMNSCFSSFSKPLFWNISYKITVDVSFVRSLPFHCLRWCNQTLIKSHAPVWLLPGLDECERSYSTFFSDSIGLETCQKIACLFLLLDTFLQRRPETLQSIWLGFSADVDFLPFGFASVTTFCPLPL